MPATAIGLAVLASTGCGGYGDAGVAPPSAGPPARLAHVAGDDQTGTVGRALATPLTVRVEDASGNALSGVRVQFEANDGHIAGLSVLAASTAGGLTVPLITGADGRAAAEWTLGTAAGEQEATAAAQGLPPVRFTARAAAGPAGIVFTVAGSGQEAPTGSTLTEAFVVLVTDAFGNPRAGERVDWVVEAGGGSLSALASTTDAEGEASTTLTLGPDPGTNSVSAHVAALPAVIFMANACDALISGADCPEVFLDATGPGDTFETGASDGLTIPDIAVIRVATDGIDIVFQLVFVNDVVSDEVGGPNVMIGFLDLDIDRDPVTGIESNVDLMRPDGGSAGLGMDYYVDMFMGGGGVYPIVDENFNQVGSVTPVFAGNAVTLTIPLSVLGGDDGIVDFALIAGGPPEPTDLAPNTGVYSNAGAAAAARAAGRPQPRPYRIDWNRRR